MKAGIHPEYETARITCACGRVTETRTTVGEIHVEICSHCHPFFTGRQKLVDTAGRVERFKAKYGDMKAAPKAAPVAEAPVESESQAADVPVAETPAEPVAETPAEPEAEAADAPEAAAENAPAEASAEPVEADGDAEEEQEEE